MTKLSAEAVEKLSKSEEGLKTLTDLAEDVLHNNAATLLGLANGCTMLGHNTQAEVARDVMMSQASLLLVIRALVARNEALLQTT